MRLIRHYQSSDMQACLHIFDGNTPRFFSLVEREDFKNFLVNEAVGWDYLVIEDNGSIVACGGHNVDKDAKSANFCWGMVANNLHSTGLGKMLTTARLKTVSAHRGVTRVRLDTSQHTQGFYARLGFVTERIIPDGYGPGLDRWEMTLNLETSDDLLFKTRQGVD
ncbi:MAG: GNAT family N-acetyltransferase [Oxalobacteraceae bacterium]|nr:MAG: GNAT family N-acetyltransferase [Oxalobacteraceae bacterium]